MRNNLKANGHNPDDLTLEEALGILEVLVVTKRAIHPRLWVDQFVNESEDAALDGLF